MLLTSSNATFTSINARCLRQGFGAQQQRGRCGIIIRQPDRR